MGSLAGKLCPLGIKDAALELLEPYARVAGIEVVDVGTGHYFCHVRMPEPEEAARVSQLLGAFPHDGGICFVIPDTFAALRRRLDHLSLTSR
jgi:hypothetical protein